MNELLKNTGILGAACVALALLSVPASTNSSPPAQAPDKAEAQALTDEIKAMHGDQPSGQPESPGSEIERFCGNIADAARDRRYVLQAKELEKLQAEIDQRMQALEAKRAEYEVWMTKREAFLAQAADGVVKIYRGMKPDAAAERLAELKPNLAAGILMKLEPRKASTILNEMKSKEAAMLTSIMASAVRREDPS
jgi:flagellar motility protein MotE (MotC chaperone)